MTRSAPFADTRPDDVPWPPTALAPPFGTELRGSTVHLRTAVPAADAAAAFCALDDDRVWAHVAGRPTAPEGWEARLRARFAGGLPWVVTLVEEVGGLPAGAVAGVTCFLDVSAADARLEIGATTFAPAVWGTRVNPEAKLLLLSLAFDSLGAGRVQLQTDVRNTRSQRAIARLGARPEGLLRRHKRRADGTLRDTALFSITAEDWPGVRDGLQERLAR